jgi:hypothetical protein
MNFGYFFLGINQTAIGSHGTVEIRPIEVGFATEAPARIVISIPLDTTHSEQTLSAVADHCLQSTRELLPESALLAWSKTWGSQALTRMTLPENAQEQWDALGSEPEPTQEENAARYGALS